VNIAPGREGVEWTPHKEERRLMRQSKRRGTARHRREFLKIAVAAFAVGSLAACAAPTGRKVCLNFHASPDLNLFDGQPHALQVRLYPMKTREVFQRMGADELLAGAQPEDLTDEPFQTTIVPGENRELRERFPLNTLFVGVLADYYRAPGERAGERKTTTRARCGWFSVPKVVLGPRGLPTD
jgi:type VI secretion system VasD/TssJ family lipoprotein